MFQPIFRTMGLAGCLMAGCLMAGGARAADNAALKVPSGQPLTLHDVTWPAAGAGKGARILRLRFVAPKIGAKGAARVGIDRAEGDMQALCDRVALPLLRKDGRTVDQIVISLMARPVDLGTSAPDVVQFFDGYRPMGDHCEWEGL